MTEPNRLQRDNLRRILRDPLILPIYAPTMLLAFVMGALTPILPIYVAEFSASYGMIGLVIAGNGIGALVGDMPAGMIIRRLGRVRGIWLGLLIAAIPTVALFWARSVPEALLYRIISGFGWALMSVARHSYLATVTNPDSRGRAISLFGGVTRIGNLAGPVTGGAIAAAFGLRIPFLLFGAACALGLLALGPSLRNGHEVEEIIREDAAPQRHGFLACAERQPKSPCHGWNGPIICHPSVVGPFASNSSHAAQMLTGFQKSGGYAILSVISPQSRTQERASGPGFGPRP